MRPFWMEGIGKEVGVEGIKLRVFMVWCMVKENFHHGWYRK